MSVLRRVRAFALCAAAVLVLPAAVAAPTSIVMSGMTPTLGGAVVQKKVVVKFDDLNPAESQGAATLLARLTTVAGKLCASNISGTGELLAEKVTQCQAKALRQAVKDVDTPALDAAASAK